MDIPQLKVWLRLPGEKKDVQIFDIKFCPYLELDEDPVFAAVAGREIYICKPLCKSNTSKSNGLEILTVLEDPDETAVLNSVAWSLDIKTQELLVCVAGSGSKKIRILNVITGDLVRNLRGHGGDVNDLVISPKSPHILASCSADYTVRIWNLDPKYERQPCAAILSGEGHRQAILSIAFHANGKWLLSSGQDTMICLWIVPTVPDENAGTDKPTEVMYPHFATIGIHSDYVDCVRFWGDLILSKASTGNNVHVKRGEILVWKIQGFSSTDEDPPDPPMPAHGRHTRSAFGDSFQRLLTFDMMNIEPFYMRFGVYDKPGQRPMLAMGNVKARFSFWDLQKFEEQNLIENAALAKNKKRKRGLAEQVLLDSTRASSNTSNLTRASSLNSNLFSAPPSISTTTPALTSTSHAPSPALARKHSVPSAYTRHPAHKMTVVQCPVDFACRAVAWSPDGKWCIGVGDHGMLTIFGRGMN